MCGNYVPISIIGRSKLVWIDSGYKSQWTLYFESKTQIATYICVQIKSLYDLR